MTYACGGRGWFTEQANVVAPATAAEVMRPPVTTVEQQGHVARSRGSGPPLTQPTRDQLLAALEPVS